MDALALLTSVAAEFGVEDLIEDRTKLQFTLPVVLTSEERVTFRLDARLGTANHVIARELDPRRLPRCCPERHINQDGSFCMNWIDGDPRPVLDLNSARAWWTLLWEFLRRQVTADTLRRWVGPVRAHGAAADYQERAERYAASLGEPIASQLARGSLATQVDHRRGRNRIAIALEGKVLNRINLPSRVLANPGMICPCPAGRESNTPIRECNTHARDFAALIDALHRWRKAEHEYVSALRANHVRCCGTLDTCPLR